MTDSMMTELDQEARDFLERSKAAIDRGDTLEWILVMAEDERKALAKYGFVPLD